MHNQLNFSYLRHTNQARRDAWHGTDEWVSSDWSNEMCGEAGEAANIVKKLRRIETGAVRDGLTDRDDLINALGLELADVIICVDLLAMYFDIDLADFIIHKFNSVSRKNGFDRHLLATTNSGFEGQGGSVRAKRNV